MDGTIGPGSDPDTAGFTLIELLVAVAVLAVLAVGASLAATRGSGGAEDAQRFADRFAALRQLAARLSERAALGAQLAAGTLARVTRRDFVGSTASSPRVPSSAANPAAAYARTVKCR